MDLTKLEPVKVSTDTGSYSTFIYGEPKIGKSTFVNELYGDRVLSIFTEKRYKNLDGAYVQYVSNWNEFLQVMKELRKPEVKAKFDLISIDTVENLFAMVEKFIAAKFNETQVGEGSVAYGKDWTALKNEWINGISLIERNGYVPVFVSHAKQVTTQIPKSAILPTMDVNGVQMEEVVKDGVEYMEFQKFVPDGNERMMGPLRKMSDNILFMHTTSDVKGNEQRVISLRGTLQWEAGSTFKDIAPIIPLSADAYKKAVEGAINAVPEESRTDERQAGADIQGEELDFESLMTQMKTLAKEYFEAGRKDEVQEYTEDVFGIGVQATAAKPHQVEIVKTLVDLLKEKK